ncbi:hypothetical protein IFM89_026787 [Coptis chinensis]|uniref:SET domain-containing protein n=1 Tax=Coptis chinensis TaxID=261450 RepID=A0A835H148_9MAGN|nr:hypothetical protein IFM89_026787 [Coptis chinensis]
MGDGGVACMPTQHVMERLPICSRGNNGYTTTSSNKFKNEKKMVVVVDKEIKVEVVEEEEEEGEEEEGEEEEEVEEGEFGCVKENGEFVPEKYKKREVEKGEFIPGKWRRGEVVRSEFSGEKRQKWEGEFGIGRRLGSEVEKGEFVPHNKWRREVDKSDYGSPAGLRRGGQRGELEKGEFVPHNKWRKEDEFVNEKGRDSRTSSELSRNSEWNKRYARWEPAQNRDNKVGLRAAADDGKNYDKEYSSLSWQKQRHGTDSGNSGNNGRRYTVDYAEHLNPKSRRIYEDDDRAGYLGDKHHSHASEERAYRTASSSARVSSSSRYSSSKHYDNSVPRRAHDRLGPGPGYFERSPQDRARHHDHRDRSPFSERSPNDQARYYDYRNRSPTLKRSPNRSRPYDRRDRSPGYLDRSPLGRGRSPHVRARHHDRRDQTPGYLDSSPHDFSRSPHRDCRDRTPGYLDRSPIHSYRDLTPSHSDKSPLDRPSGDCHEDGEIRKGREEERSSNGQQGHRRDSNEHSPIRQPQLDGSLDNDSGSVETNPNDQSHGEEKPQEPTVVCADPPPQVSGTAEEMSMEEDMDISNTPPHVPFLNDSAIGTWFYLDHFGMEQGPSKLCNLKRLVEDGVLQSDHLVKHSGSDWWVTVENAASPALPTNFTSIVADTTVTQLVNPPEAPGNLLEDVGDAGEGAIQVDQEPSGALQLSPLDVRFNALGSSEDLQIDVRVNALLKGYAIIPGRELEILGEALHAAFEHTDWEKWGNINFTSKEAVEPSSVAFCNKEYTFPSGDSGVWFSGQWSCMGGDWKRNDEPNQDKISRKKTVLNDGYRLCQMPKSGFEDPRWCRKDELYYPSRSRKLSLPSWVFSLTEERNDCNGTSKTSQMKAPLAPRGVKGTMLPVVRINACVVNNQGSLVPESRVIVRGSERYSSRSNRSFSSGNDGRSLSAEGASQSKRVSEKGRPGLQKCVEPIITPKDRVCTVDDLQLHLGDWYYYDGAGHEHGPLSFIDLQALVEIGTIQKHTSVFRKFDSVWVPVSSDALGSKASVSMQDVEVTGNPNSSAAPSSQSEVSKNTVANAGPFHQLHPQFIGYTRGKLHELVMKSYKSREFAAAINEVLDPWISAKQPKKDEYVRPGKRARLLVDDSEDDYDLEAADLHRGQKDDCSFDDLYGDATFGLERSTRSEVEMESWGLLNGYILARVFHFLRADMKSLAFSAATCKHWNSAAKFYRDISKQVDLSDAGPECSDSVFRMIMSCYNNMKIASIVMIGCTNISANTLEEILLSFPSISYIDIRGCTQFKDLTQKFQNIKWIVSPSLRGTKIYEDSYSKIKSLKQISEKGLSFSKGFKGSSSHLNEFGEGDCLPHDSSLDGRDSTSRSFRQSFYKRKKLLDSRKSSSLLSRDARMRHWLYRKSENGYKRMEEFLAFSLKDIMKENTFDFFVPKVAEIEDKMRNGYYKGRGLSLVKEDIGRMCRDAINLEENAGKSSRERDELLKLLKDKSKKKHLRIMNERKSMRSNGNSNFSGGADYGEYASDREIRRRLSKLNKKPLDSGSDTSDELHRSSEDSEDDSESTVSDTESDLGFRSEAGLRDFKGDGYFMDDEALDSTNEDREWGARMTKASLVPPVTRKYEVIDHYVIIADEEEVQRKMRVSLPEDYAEKLNAQKNGAEESDMEIPEVKDYKPRKQLGGEVLEQEVYGIDPYTHNLLLDSMPEELDWPLLEKHVFIEDTLLRALNMQVRHFTGTGNAPMKYPLQPVVEELQMNAAKEGDKRVIKMCMGILKAHGVGLGVVCNKEEGIGEDDFVVEFLGEVYPTWKWFEKQDGIRSLQKNKTDPAPEFYNIYLERPKGDRDGYDLVVVDAMHKANYASRICHSCRPNCEAKVTAVDGQYQIGVYTVRPIGYGEEITFDYNSVTESKEEYEASVCLCGSQICRGSYLNLTGEGAYQKVLMECHGMLDRHRLMLESCELNYVSEEDYFDLGRAGLGTCLLDGLPVWLVAYSALGWCAYYWLVTAIHCEVHKFERTKLPEEILRHNLEEKKKFFSDICIEVEKNDAEVQAEGVYNQRLQNLALTLDKVRYVMRCIYHDPKKAPPPLKKLNPEEVVSVLWKGEGSLVEELLECMVPHTEESLLNDLRSKIHGHDPSGSDDLMGELQNSLLWLRDEVRNLPCTYKCRHDAAADLIHIYAYTKCFFGVQEYKSITSPPVYISPLDLGPKYADKLGSGLKEYCKKYGENYCLGQLINWHGQNNADPDCCLLRAARGCLSLPEIASFYAKANKPSRLTKFMAPEP